MTQPSGPAGPFQMPTTMPATEGKGVSPAGYWIGGAILLFGCGGAIIWLIVAAVGLVNAPDDFDRIRVPGSTVLTLDDGDWMIYQEFQGASSGRFESPPSVFVTDPSGRDVSLRTVGGDYSYDTGSYEGAAVWEFTASTAGAYTIETSTVGEPTLSRNLTIAVGRPLFDISEIGGLLGSLALGAVSFIVGLVILIVTIVRRSRVRRRMQPAMAPYGTAPYPGAPHGAAYGPPGGPAQPASWPSAPTPGWSPPTAPPPPADTPNRPPPPPGGPPPPPGGPPSPWTPPGQSDPGDTRPADSGDDQ